MDDRHLVVQIMEGGIWLDYQGKRQLGFLEEGVRRGNGVQCGAHVLGRAVGVR
jgi:hypothetical protein